MSGEQRAGYVYGDPAQGQVVRIVEDRGFAFVRSGDKEYFLHCSDYADGEWANLKPGTMVEFVPVVTPKGLRAEQVVRVR